MQPSPSAERDLGEEICFLFFFSLHSPQEKPCVDAEVGAPFPSWGGSFFLWSTRVGFVRKGPLGCLFMRGGHSTPRHRRPSALRQNPHPCTPNIGLWATLRFKSKQPKFPLSGYFCPSLSLALSGKKKAFRTLEAGKYLPADSS